MFIVHSSEQGCGPAFLFCGSGSSCLQCGSGSSCSLTRIRIKLYKMYNKLSFKKISVDENGIMCVSATEESSKKSNQMTIKNDKGRISESDISKMIEESEKYAQYDKEVRDNIDAKISLESYVASLRRTFDDPSFKDFAGDAVCTCLSDRLNEVTNWLDENEKPTKAECDKLRTELENEMYPHVERFANKQNGDSSDSENDAEIEAEIEEIKLSKSGKITD